MRMMMTVQVPTQAGNDAIRDGSLPKIIESVLAALNAEAAYFTAADGMRTGLIFFEMEDSSDIPSAAEPLFMGLKAGITFAPVMNVEELRAGIGKAMAAA